MALADELTKLKPEWDDIHRGAQYSKAMLNRSFERMLTWMRKIDGKDTHHAFLGSVGFGLRKLDSDPAVRNFIDQVCGFYLVELPDSSLSPDDQFEVMADFAYMAADAGPAHAQQFFDRLPMNLYEALDTMPHKSAKKLFDSLNYVRGYLNLNVGIELHAGGKLRPEPLTPREERFACMIKAGHDACGLQETRGVRMGAKLGCWALKSPANEKAAFRIAELTPHGSDIERSIENRSMCPRPLDLSGLGIDSLPPGIETLTYITRFDLSGNNFERIPMELYDMGYFSGYPHQIEFDLRDNPLSLMTADELRKLDSTQKDRSNRRPLFKLPRVVALADGTQFRSWPGTPKFE